MNTIKTYFFERFSTFFYLSLSMITSLVILMIRLKITHTFYLLFLVWNLFLAFIPFAISNYLVFKQEQKRSTLLMAGLLWLLFLPNAPYILTDYIHLLNSDAILWYDSIMISSFAFNGLLLYFLSVRDMKAMLMGRLSTRIFKIGEFLLPFVVSFGIYLGRFMRWNSWDIVSDPIQLILDITSMFAHPFYYLTDWLIIFVLGIFLISINYFLKRMKFLKFET